MRGETGPDDLAVTLVHKLSQTDLSKPGNLRRIPTVATMLPHGDSDSLVTQQKKAEEKPSTCNAQTQYDLQIDGDSMQQNPHFTVPISSASCLSTLRAASPYILPVTNVVFYSLPLCLIYFAFNAMSDDSLGSSLFYGADSFGYNLLPAVLFAKNFYNLIKKLGSEGAMYRAFVGTGLMLAMLTVFAAIKLSIDGLKGITKMDSLIAIGVCYFSFNMLTTRTNGAADTLLTLYHSAWHAINRRMNPDAQFYYQLRDAIARREKWVKAFRFDSASANEPITQYLNYLLNESTRLNIPTELTRSEYVARAIKKIAIGVCGLLAVSLYSMFLRVTLQGLNELTELLNSNFVRAAIPYLGIPAALTNTLFYGNTAVREPDTFLDFHHAVTEYMEINNYSARERAFVYAVYYPAFLSFATISGRGIKKEVQKTLYPDHLAWTSTEGLNGLFSAGLTVNGKANASVFLAIIELVLSKDISKKRACLEYFFNISSGVESKTLTSCDVLKKLDNALYAGRYTGDDKCLQLSDTETLARNDRWCSMWRKQTEAGSLNADSQVQASLLGNDFRSNSNFGTL